MSIDPRLMERRQTVAEDNAKRNVWRLLKFLAFVVAAGAVVWLFFSPWLSVKEVRTFGVEASTANSILADHRVVAGRPMIQVDAGGVEAALMDDPWIADAEIRRLWPDLVEVEVEERSPVAWVSTEGGWTRRAIDGVALPSDPEPDAGMARIEMPDLAEVGAATTPELLGALEFIAALPESHHAGTVLSSVDGELWAVVDGYQVRLGRAVDMTAKALSLVALLGERLPVGSVLVLIAPTNPAVSTPGDPVDAVAGDDTGVEEEGATEEEEVEEPTGVVDD